MYAYNLPHLRKMSTKMANKQMHSNILKEDTQFQEARGIWMKAVTFFFSQANNFPCFQSQLHRKPKKLKYFDWVSPKSLALDGLQGKKSIQFNDLTIKWFKQLYLAKFWEHKSRMLQWEDIQGRNWDLCVL